MRALPIAGLVAALAVACAPSRPDGGGDGAAADAGARPVLPDGSPPPPAGDAGACEEVVDLVFVLDTSSSMDFVLAELEAQIGSVVAAANQVAADAHFGLVVFQDDVWLDDSGPLSGGVVHTSASALQSAFSYYRDTFTRWDRNPGDGPGGPTRQNPICEENALDALYLAADRFPWRDNATRVIIVATDDTFLERPDNYGDRDGDGATNRTDFPREGDYPAERTLAETLARLRAERTRVFSFTRLTEPGIFVRCGTDRRLPWSAIRWGWSEPYRGEAPIPEQTDASNFDIARVQDGSLDLAATINEVVLESYCVPPIL